MGPARTNNKEDWRPAPDNYEPRSLPGFLDPLIEQLAEKVHDKWAERRITEGWSFGPRRDDERKYAGETSLPKGFGSLQLYHLTSA